MFKNTKQKNLFDSFKSNEKQIVEFDESEWDLITAKDLLKEASPSKPQKLISNEHKIQGSKNTQRRKRNKLKT